MNNEWISVEDSLPHAIDDKDYTENVLAVYKGYLNKSYINVFCRQYVDDGEHSGWVWARITDYYSCLRDAGCEWDDDYQVTHWQPLPEPPH